MTSTGSTGLGWAKYPITGVHIRKRTQKEERHVMLDVEIGVMRLQTKGCQGLPGTTKLEETKQDSPLPIPALQFSSVQVSRSVMSDFLQPHALQHARLPCPSPTPRAYSNSCPSSR